LQELKGNAALLPVYAALIVEARKSMDDWIPVAALQPFKQWLARYGLTVTEDCLFEPLPAEGQPDGTESAPTTHARGLSIRDLEAASPAAQAHVFVSKRRQWAEDALASLSYPVAVPRDRLLVRPRIDSRLAGAAFGYPDCCTEAFVRWNDWRLRSHFSRIFRGAGTADWGVNCLPRATPFMTVFHAPCEATCAATTDMSRRTLEAVNSFDPDYGRAIVDHLRGVFLVFHEALVYKLYDAEIESGRAAAFSAAEPIALRRRSPQTAAVAGLLESATWLELADGILITRGAGQEDFYELDPGAEWVEDPCLIRFE
jgi:hypothetical protein